MRQTREVDRLVAVAADEHGVVARAFHGVREHGGVRKHVEKRRELAAHGVLRRLVELHEDRYDAAVVEPGFAELPELARVQRGGALDPRIERIGRDRIEAFCRRSEQMPAVVDADLDLAVRHDAEVVLGEKLGSHLRNERLELGDDDALDGRIDADGARRDAGAEAYDEHAARPLRKKRRQMAEHSLQAHVLRGTSKPASCRRCDRSGRRSVPR